MKLKSIMGVTTQSLKWMVRNRFLRADTITQERIMQTLNRNDGPLNLMLMIFKLEITKMRKIRNIRVWISRINSRITRIETKTTTQRQNKTWAKCMLTLKAALISNIGSSLRGYQIWRILLKIRIHLENHKFKRAKSSNAKQTWGFPWKKRLKK